MGSNSKLAGSTAAHPDLDWSQVRETVLMLKLAAAQVEFSLKDGDRSVDVLTDSFTSMADEVRAIELGLGRLSDSYQISADDQMDVDRHCQEVSRKMQQAIIAFQFYDTLVQRLDHVVSSLSELGELVSEPARLYSPEEWRALQETIRSRYNMEKERELFDAILSGDNMEDVIRRMQKVALQPRDDVELF